MTEFGLVFAPLAPVWLLALFAVLAAVLVAAALFLRRRGALLRGLVFLLLLGALAGPSLVQEQRKPLKDVVAVVLDRSASQNFGVRRAQTDAARGALKAALNKLGNVEVRFIEAGDARDGDEDQGTRLFSALNQGLADVPSERLGGVIMVTDGIVHDIPPTLAAANLKAPLQVLVTGEKGERDRRVELVEAPRYGLIGKTVTFKIRVDEANGPGEPVPVTVSRDGSVVSRVLAIPGDVVKVPVKVDHGGRNVVEFDAEPMPNELTLVNNKASATVDGVRDHLKVLLVSGEPNPGERAWRNLLKSDANVELVHFTILRPPEKQDLTPIRELALIAFPTAELFGRKIRDFDLIVFDRYSNMGLLPPQYFDNIVDYVRRGGALAIVAGPNFAGADGLYYTPIGRVIPVRPTGKVIEQPFRAALTTIGARDPVTRGLPGAGQSPAGWSQWFRQVQAVSERGVTVLSGVGGAPILTLAHEGKGRVALLLTDQMWLWARGFEGGGPYEDLMRRTAHWLMKQPELAEEALRGEAHGRELVIERQTLGDHVPPVHIVSPSGKTRDVVLTKAEPGLFRGKIAAKELGLYRLSQGDLKALVNVGPANPLEYREVVSTTKKLRPLAEATGGSARRIGVPGTSAIHMPRIVAMRDSPIYAGADFIAIRRTGASVAKGVKLEPLAVGFIGLLLLLGALVAAWAYEGFGRKAGSG